MKILAAHSKIATFSALLLCAAGAIFFIPFPNPPEWNLKTTFSIGVSIDPIAIVEGSNTPRHPLERYRAVVGLISSPAFRETVADTSEFEPDSAALSKRLVFQSLRAYFLNDYDIEIELTAASAADCRAAFRTIVNRIEQRHAVLFDQNAKLLRTTIDDYRERSIQLKKWGDAMAQTSSQALAEHANGNDKLKSDLGSSWNDTRERLRRLEAVELLMKPTQFPAEADVYVNGPLTKNTARLSAAAGLILILFIIILALGLEIRRSLTGKSKI